MSVPTIALRSFLLLHLETQSSFIERILQEEQEVCECCVCPSDINNNEVTTIQLLAVGGEGHYLDFVPDRFSHRTEKFFNRTGIRVQVVRLGDLDNLNKEILADVSAQVYDGYVFLPFLTGSLVEQKWTR